jgi:L-alanine-DL-glutamate epimerase-like enolase superfamily enzyme
MGIGNAHICGAIPNNDFYDQLVISTEQINELRRMPELLIVDGYLTVPEEPGLGPQTDWDRLERTALAIV